MGDTFGNIAIAVVVGAGIIWLVWRGMRRMDPSAPPRRENLYRDAILPGPQVPEERPQSPEDHPRDRRL